LQSEIFVIKPDGEEVSVLAADLGFGYNSIVLPINSEK